MSNMLKVVTFNVKHSTHARDTVAALEAINTAEAPDFFCLQEVSLKWCPGTWRTLIGAAELRLGMTSAYALHPHVFTHGVEGVAVLSRHPIISKKPIKLSRGRAYIQTTALVDGVWPVNVSSVHISGGDQELRHAEICRLLNCSMDYRTILAGDFNERPLSKGIRLVEKKYSGDTAFEPTAAFGLAPRKLDYVFCSLDMEHVGSRTIHTEVSDHEAVLSELAPRTI